jgi:hypothetical protein
MQTDDEMFFIYILFLSSMKEPSRKQNKTPKFAVFVACMKLPVLNHQNCSLITLNYKYTQRPSYYIMAQKKMSMVNLTM